MLSRGGVPKIFDARKPYNAWMLSYAPDLYVSRYIVPDYENCAQLALYLQELRFIYVFTISVCTARV